MTRSRDGAATSPQRGAGGQMFSLASWYQFAATAAFRRLPRVCRSVRNAGEIADFVMWVDREFDRPRLHRCREQLWQRMLLECGDNRVCGVEFGVAQGYATTWWLSRLNSSRVEWHGFDRFTGLPRPWRDLDAGAFDNNGKPPRITHPGLRWHVGDVEQTVAFLDTCSWEYRTIVLFDLDLYEPSKVAWHQISGKLKAGDLLYFDEAFDADERRLLVDDVLVARAMQCVGFTPLSLALRVI